VDNDLKIAAACQKGPLQDRLAFIGANQSAEKAVKLI